MDEILGTDAVVTYTAGELVVRELGSDGRERLRATAHDLLDVWCAQASVQVNPDEPPVPHHVLLRLIFRSPDFIVDDRPVGRAPVDVELPLSALARTLDLVKAVTGDLRESRRTRAERPALPIPVNEPGVLRADLAAAFARLAQQASAGHAASATHTYLGQDEAVIGCATSGPGMLLTVTTRRVLFVVVQQGHAVAHEFPLEWVEEICTEKDAHGWPTTLHVRDGFTGLRFQGADPRDAQALVEAVTPVIEADRIDGLVGARTPGPVELFAEWQLLVERRQLGMVDDEEMQRTGAGILTAMP